MKAILLPVKDLSNVKQRLAPLLSGPERRELFRAMLKDVTGALNQSKAADRIVVVTCDPWMRSYAAAQGWDVLMERQQTSESDSVDRASSILRGQGVQAVLRVPADIPLVQAEDLDLLLHAGTIPPAALLVPSRDRTGTNALLRRPPDIFPSRFGKNSFLLHHQEAERAGASLTVIENTRVSLDLDEAADLFEFLERGHGTLTLQVLEQIGIVRRAKT